MNKKRDRPEEKSDLVETDKLNTERQDDPLKMHTNKEAALELGENQSSNNKYLDDDKGKEISEEGKATKKDCKDVPISDGRWKKDEHERFLLALRVHGNLWPKVAEFIGTRTPSQTRSHAQKHFNKITMQKIRKELKAEGKRKIFVATRYYLNRTTAPEKLIDMAIVSRDIDMEEDKKEHKETKGNLMPRAQEPVKIMPQCNPNNMLPCSSAFKRPEPVNPFNRFIPNPMVYFCYMPIPQRSMYTIRNNQI